MGESIKDYKVTITNTTTIAAALPLQEHWLPLSNLDLLLPPLDVGIFFCYNKPQYSSTTKYDNMEATVGELKKALAKTLVAYYAFAGEVVTNSGGEPELLCNNRGVDFVEARADVELRDLELYDADESVEGKLVPTKKAGVIAVQVTELKCGSVVVGCTFDHRVADAHSTQMFLLSLSDAAHSKRITLLPSFRRSVFSPRRPVHPDPTIDKLYISLSAFRPPKLLPSNHPINRIYHVSSAHVRRLQTLAGRSKLESFSAYLWQAIARSAGPGVKSCSMGVVVDGRSRLGRETMSRYFGNVLTIPSGTMSVAELDAMGLEKVAERVHEMVSEAATEEHFLGLVDWVEARRPEPAAAKIYCVGEEDRVAFVVSSGQRFPVEKVELGWGKAAFGSYHFPWGGNAGYVMPMPSSTGTGDWVVYMHLRRGILMELEKVEGEIFRPLVPEHLGLDD